MTSHNTSSWAYQLAESIDCELLEFEEQVRSFLAGRCSGAEFRAYRVPMGVYEQRESGTYMVRVRLPAGAVTPSQMRRLALVSESSGDGILHVTTRQDIQVHRVAVEQICQVLTELRGVGLSTQGGGGNTVRNVTSCSDAGICEAELFDVRPYAIALTERLVSDPLSRQLPRKYKIAFSGCARDCSVAGVNDLGFVAKEREGELGFAVFVGGGLGSKSRIGDSLHDFVPASEAIFVAEAIKRVFDKHGDRRNKHTARLRFLVERLGFFAFKSLYEEELVQLRTANTPALQVRRIPKLVPIERMVRSAERAAKAEAFEPWRRSNVVAQQQAGYQSVVLPLQLGNISATQLSGLADVVAQHGEGALQATQSQNLVLRWVRESELETVHSKLTALGLAEPVPAILRDLVACAGASTCRLGLCQSRGLAEALTQRLQSGFFDLHQLGGARVNISGCPNACGRHPIGDIGLYGAARRVDDKLVPYYFIQIGGGSDPSGARLGEVIGAVPARSVPECLEALISAWMSSGTTLPFVEYIRGNGKEQATEVVSRYHRARPANMTIDWGSRGEFSLIGRGAAECGAGVFDLIELDLGNAARAVSAQRRYRATLLAARALLVTKGHHPNSDSKALEVFQEQFLDEGLVDSGFGPLLAEAIRVSRSPDPEQGMTVDASVVSGLVAAVTRLYQTMDASLRFKSSTRSEALGVP